MPILLTKQQIQSAPPEALNHNKVGSDTTGVALGLASLISGCGSLLAKDFKKFELQTASVQQKPDTTQVKHFQNIQTGMSISAVTTFFLFVAVMAQRLRYGSENKSRIKAGQPRAWEPQSFKTRSQSVPRVVSPSE